MATMSKGD